jgi:hypothetical protein
MITDLETAMTSYRSRKTLCAQRWYTDADRLYPIRWLPLTGTINAAHYGIASKIMDLFMARFQPVRGLTTEPSRKRKFLRGVRRTGIVAAGVLLAAVAGVAVATPAQASIPGCHPMTTHYSVPGYVVTASKVMVCNDGDTWGLPVSIQRFEGNDWVTLASDYEVVDYFCTGSQSNLYSVSGSDLFWADCG